MNPQKELSYDRLASRTKYYQEKSLQLEKQLLFAEDKVEQLESQLKEALENDELDKELEHKEEMLTEYRQTIQQLNEQLSATNLSSMENKIKSFEELLETIEKDLNDKEMQLESYRNKIKSLEKRLKFQNHDQAPDEASIELKKKEDLQLTGFFNYSLICNSENSYVIHGSLHMTNTGTEPLENPLICLRFQPIDYTVLKGKIGSLEQAVVTEDQKDKKQWIFVENEWAKDARERGEVWVSPIYDLTISVNETISLTDFQIPIQKQFEDNITIEGFIYFQNQNYRARAMNQIALNF